MRYLKPALPVIGAAFLAACSTAPTAPTLPDVPSVGMANNAGGTYTIVTNGSTFTMTGTNATSSSAPDLEIWNGAAGSATMKGAAFQTADVLAIAAMNKAGPNETFAGITGTLGTVPTSGMAAYNIATRFFLLEPTNLVDGPARMYGAINGTVNVDFNAASLSASLGFGTFIEGDIVGSEFTGTFSALGGVNATPTTVPMQGGFYGANGGTIAGAFAGTGLSGVFGGPVVVP